jgi:serine/threonine protein kinase
MHAAMDRLQESLGEEFELLRPLGEGSVAEVFLARETALDRPVAIKILRGALARDGTARKRFVREARLAARIHHPNVVSVYRVGELEPHGRPYLVMEYIDGRTYADILAATGPLEEGEVRRLLGEICEALEVAHQLGIIHRDVRPGNIMLSRDGERIVLTDFGLAGILESGGEVVTRLTQSGEILGDVRYTAPEQLTGGTVEPGSDIYALAVTAYELLTGNGPFPDATKPARLVQAHVAGEPTPIRAISPSISPALEDVLLRCLHKRPEHRPSAALVGKRVASGTEGAQEDAPEGALESFLSELKRRHVYKVGAAYGAFILVVLAVVDGALPALPFDIPDWTDTVLVTASLAGLPIALILGWFYDVTSSGVERTRSLAEHTPRSVRLLQAAGVMLALAVAVLIGWLVLGR